MALFVQVDSGVVTGVLSSSGTLDAATFPAGRRFVRLDDDATPPAHLSTVTIAGDKGDPIIEATGVTFTPPVPVPPPVDPVLEILQSMQTKQEEILTEVKKPQV